MPWYQGAALAERRHLERLSRSEAELLTQIHPPPRPMTFTLPTDPLASPPTEERLSSEGPALTQLPRVGMVPQPDGASGQGPA